MRRADHLFRGVLQNVVYLSVIVKPRQLATGACRTMGKNVYIYIYLKICINIYIYINIQYTIQLVLHIRFIEVVITCVLILRMACFLSHSDVCINSIVPYHCLCGLFITRVHIVGNAFVGFYKRFLNAFAKLCKATVIIVMPVRLSVCPSVSPHGTVWFPLTSGISVYFENLSRNVKFL